MNEFDYKIFHVEGKENVIANQLSRCFIYIEYNEEKNKTYKKLIQRASYYKDGKYELDSQQRILIKDTRANNFLNQVHKHSGHREISTLYYNLQEIIYIKNMFNKIKEIVNKCKTCKRYKSNTIIAISYHKFEQEKHSRK